MGSPGTAARSLPAPRCSPPGSLGAVTSEQRTDTETRPPPLQRALCCTLLDNMEMPGAGSSILAGPPSLGGGMC